MTDSTTIEDTPVRHQPPHWMVLLIAFSPLIAVAV